MGLSRHRRMVVLIASVTAVMVAASAFALPASGFAPTYHSPGYAGTHRLPKVAPLAPPPALDIGRGSLPHVLVDAAGTGHITWTANPPGGESVLHYCRLNRGQRTCSAQASLIPPDNDSGYGNGPQTDVDFAGPYPFSIGNELLVLDNRCCNHVPTPDGASSDGANFLYSSEDGGRTLTGPGILGTQEPGSAPAVFGGDAPQIGVISDTETGGTFFQSTSGGSFTSRTVNLGNLGTDEAYAGRVATDGTRPVVSFADLNEHIFVREYSGRGDIYDPGNWSVAKFTGENPRLVGGPAGVWIAYQPSSGAPYRIRRVVDGIPSAGWWQITPPEGVEGINSFQLVEDSEGHLTAGWINSGTPGRVVIRTSPNATRWSADQVIATHLDDPGALSLAAGPDGGGYAVFEQAAPAGQQLNRVTVAAFGAISATGQKGLGNLDGGGLGGLGGDQLASASCTDVRFGAVHAIAEAGCFLRDPKNPAGGAAVTQSEIRLNGLEIIPDPGVSIAIDPRQHTINTTGAVSVVLRAPVVGDVTIWHGGLAAKLPGALADAGQTLFEFDTSQYAATLKGFPIDAMIEVQLRPDGVVIPVSLKLPPYMGGVTGEATLLADNVHGLRFDSLHIGVADLNLGALEVKDLSIRYAAEGNVWMGGATLNIPAGTPYFGITVAVEFDNGDFTMGSFHVNLPYPGVPIFTDAYLNGFGGGFDIHPPTKRFFGELTVGAIPLDPPNYVITVRGVLSMTFIDNGPVIIELDGYGALHGFQIATAKLIFQTNGYFEVDGGVDIDLGVAAFQANLKAFVDLPAGSFSSELKGALSVFDYRVADADAVISTRGVGVCGSAFGLTLGFGYVWGGSVDAIAGVDSSCDLSPYVVQPVSNASRDGGVLAHAASAGVEIPPGAAFEDIAVTGAGAPPSVVLNTPSGQQVTPAPVTKLGAPVVALTSHRNSTTYVLIRRPRAGHWTVSAAPGSTTITAVSSARGFARPVVDARVTGSGYRRVLTYRDTSRPGLTVTFAESGAGVYHVIGTTSRASGMLRFAPADGPAGARRVLAIVSENGVPRMRLTVARYTAPGPLRPGRVRGLRASRHGARFTVSFGSASNATHYLVRVTASDGRHEQKLLGVRGHTFRLPVIGYSDRIAVTVSGLSRLGRQGPPAHAAAR